SPTLRLGLYALDHHLLPEPFVEGLIFANASSRSRPSFFLGSISTSGHLAYFPLAFLVKTPLTTLFILLLSLLLFASPFAPSRSLLLIPFLIYLLPTLFTSINIGIRHILPLYPLLYIAAAIPLSRLYTQYPKLLRPLFALLFLTLSIETLTAYPNYIPFFNAAAGGYRGGLHLLGDSNLDWGQDLPLLADWQQHHPGRTLHLAYFGTADPAYYGIHYQNLPHGYRFSPDPPPPPALPTTGVLAISASNLQSVEFSDPHDPIYVPFLHRKPTLILGGSIYLFDLDHPTR
ncbi:MAG TPA: hypothetical protein VFE58_05430, partial [Tepidisphaeraceae bacterium]|nr:hypothetical protein [Tepidisphaeraceae bacterium]